MIAYPSEAKRQSVVFTELLITLSLVFTFFVAHGQFGTFSLQQSFLKHFVAVFLISASAMEYFGYRLFSHDLDESKRLNTGSYWLCLCLLGVFIVCGSVYARSELKIQDTFFINGLYILVGFAFSLTLRRNNLDRLINTVFWITLVFAIIVCVASIYARIVDLKVNETFIHEREFLVIPLIYVVVFGRVVRGWLRTLMLFLVIAAAGAALKNTPMIVLGLTLLMSYWRWWTDTEHIGRDTSKKAFATILGLVFLLTLLLAYAAFTYYVGGNTPKPNIDFRQHQFGIAWKEFLDSPIVGKAFTGETGIYFNLWFDTTLGLRTLPTHNDVLDLLRAGGMVAFLLWFAPLSILYWRAFMLLGNVAGKRAWDRKHDELAWLLLVNLAAVIVYSLNPLLSKTAFAAIVWIFFALLAAAVTRMRIDLAVTR